MEKEADKLTNRDIAIFALYLLGGWQRRVHPEDIALKCYELAPNRFSWAKYPQYPDLAPARFALEKAKKPSNGALVEGRSEKKRAFNSIVGWLLTANGVQWIEVNKARIEKSLGKHAPIGDRLSAERKLKESVGSVAFKKFTDYGDQAEISHAEFAESLICTVNTKPKVLSDRLEQLYAIAEELRREEVKKYVNFCRKKFALLLEERKGVK